MKQAGIRTLDIGEKVESIILAKRDLDIGSYLGSSDRTFGAAKVEGMIFKVERNIEVTEVWYWRVRNITNDKVVTTSDRYALPLAVRDAA